MSLSHPIYIPVNFEGDSYESLEKVYIEYNEKLIPFDYNFLINFGQVAFREGHIRRAIEITREALIYATNKNDRAYVYVLLSRGYRMMIQMQNAQSELKRACIVMGVDYPNVSLYSFIKLFLSIFLQVLKKEKKYPTSHITVENKILVELYEELGLCSYYMRYSSVLLFQISFQVRKIVSNLGPSIETVNYLGATATVFGIHKIKRLAYRYLELSKKSALLVEDKHAITKYYLWEALTVSYLDKPIQSAEFFEKIVQVYEHNLRPDELRLVCSTLSTNYNLRGKSTLSLTAVDHMITEYDARCDKIFSCCKTFTEWNKIPALCFNGEMEAAEKIIINSRAIFSSVDNEKWQIVLFLGDLLIYHYISPLRNIDDVRGILKRFNAIGLSPRKTFLEAHHFWIAKAYLLLDMFYDKKIALQDVIAAFNEVKNTTKFKTAQSHYLVLEGHKNFINKQYGKVQKLLPDMINLADACDNDWALYEAMKLDVLVTLALNSQGEGMLKYNKLILWLEEKKLNGFILNLKKRIFPYIT